jgi:hypothetical protein
MRVFSLIALFMAVTISALAEENDFKASGSLYGHANFRFESDITNKNSYFDFERVRLGYKYKFSPNLSAKVALEGKQGVENGKYENLVYVRNAQFTYTFDKTGFALTGGLVSTKLCKVQEKFWSRRYIAKSFTDENKFGSTNDFGLVLTYKQNSMFDYDLAFLNGKGYKSIERDSTFRAAFGINFKPIKGLIIRAYADSRFVMTERDEEDRKAQTTLMGFIGYSNEIMNLGFEYNLQNNYKMAEDKNQSGFSVYGTGNINEDWQVFGRFDQLNSKDDWNTKLDGNTAIVGVQYKLASKVYVAPNYKLWQPNKDGADDISYAVVNMTFKF